jgi:N-acetyl-alpha-D-muramate 1-phosphate uridylyltransferase
MSLPQTGHAVPSTAMVMAAGKGTRMRPLTNDRPKPLVTIGGETLLDHVLKHLRGASVGRIVANVHYLADMIEAHLAEHASDFDVVISDERDALLETGGGLMRAKPMLRADPFICVNTDNVWTDNGENSFVHLAKHWDDARMDALMLVVPREQALFHAGRGDFNLDVDGQLSRRLPDQNAPFVWTGIQLLSQRLLVDPPGDAFSTNIFWDRAIAQGRLFGVVHHGSWVDVGTPEAIPAAEAVLRRD